ncbi:DPH3-like protein [Camelus dromedarius]|uniref:Diphthamide biosynthesis protein 3 n=1 Tax=Camelus dromedarius TaxID=9838 RepID=A0A5N4EKC1_CAMDR|nr:DPH3-like protein [Camelus dromedarius]
MRRKRSFLRRCAVTSPGWAAAREVRPRPESEGGGGSPVLAPVTMAVFHDEVEIEDFQYDEDSETYFYPCPCGDNFCITKEDLENGEDVATCPSCSLIIKVIYDKDQFTCGETVPAPSTNKELVKC